MDDRALSALIDALEKDRPLYEPNQLQRRVEALDSLETYLLHGQHREGELESPLKGVLRRRAEALCAHLEVANRELYQSIRHKIRHGAGVDGLFDWATASSGTGRPLDQLNGAGYDYLDVLVSGVLQFEEPGEEIAELPPEMVFYQPTPARLIFDLIGRAGLGEKDVLMDLGSGLGHVSLLAAICTRARCIGIEREAAYVACATQSAYALNVSNVTFLQQDVRSADFSSGTVFYLYTPFSGTILRTVLDMLKREAATRDIRICTLGPCTSSVAEQRWLSAERVPEIDQITVFRSA